MGHLIDSFNNGRHIADAIVIDGPVAQIEANRSLNIMKEKYQQIDMMDEYSDEESLNISLKRSLKLN